MLAGVVGRWGLGRKVRDGVLPAALRDREGEAKGKGKGKERVVEKITEIIEDEDEEEEVKEVRKNEELEEWVRSVWEIVGFEEDETEGTKEWRRIVLPQLFLPLLAGLLELAFANSRPLGDGPAPDPEASEIWAKESLRVFCSRYVLVSFPNPNHKPVPHPSPALPSPSQEPPPSPLRNAPLPPLLRLLCLQPKINPVAQTRSRPAPFSANS